MEQVATPQKPMTNTEVVASLSEATDLTKRQGSQHDFIQALHALQGADGCDSLLAKHPSGNLIPVHISCPHGTWVDLFGDLHSVTEHHTVSARLPVHVWQHHCDDGPVTCIGHLFERSPNHQWVVLMRISLADHQ
jgi:hypothetical protein